MKKTLIIIISTTTGLMAGVWDWLKIIGDIIVLLFSNPGIDAQIAVHQVSLKHNVPKCEIWRHGGFGYEDQMPEECSNEFKLVEVD